jgi:hypothetical protein
MTQDVGTVPRNTGHASNAATAHSAYLSLLKQALTASIYPESAWSIIRPGGGKGLAAKVKSYILHRLTRRGLMLVSPLPLDERLRAEGRDWPAFGYSMIGMRRLENIEMCIRSVVSEGIAGDFVECGVWRGGACIFARAVLNSLDDARTVWLADSFEGMPVPFGADKVDPDLAGVSYLAVSLEDVQKNFERFGLLDSNVRFIKGWFSETLPNSKIENISVLRLDGDYYSSTMDALNSLYDRVSKGGYIIIDDYYAFASCRQAVTEFCSARKIMPRLINIDWTGVYWRKEP